MKKITILLSLIALLVVTQVTSAQTVEPTATPESTEIPFPPAPPNPGQIVRDRLNKNEELRQRIKDQIAERKEEIEARLSEQRKHRIRLFYARLETRIGAVLTRLETLIERIEARLAALTEEGEDVSSIEAEIELAKELLEDARGLLISAGEELESVLGSDDPKHAFSVVRDTIMNIKDTLVETHQILVKVIGDIKGLRVGAEGGSK